MTLFETVKETVPVRVAAEHYGIEIGKNGMACCPFHKDKNPSLKIYEDHFHCFGCGEHGDVIDLVGKLFGISPKQSAEKLAADLGIQMENLNVRDPQGRLSVISKLEAAKELKMKENRCRSALCSYIHLLNDRKERHAPKTEDEEWHPLFLEALQKVDHAEYLLGILSCGSLEERAAIVREMGKGLEMLERRIAALSDGSKDGQSKAEQQSVAESKKSRTTSQPEKTVM